jgi:5'-methylthioadenosine phosphorylase
VTGEAAAPIGIVGGSGLYEFFDAPESVSVATPYGDPSAPLTRGTIGGRDVVFLPRHGAHHEYPPHLINYRANLWALASLGVQQVLAPCAVGSLTAAFTAGTFVVPDQLVDRTTVRDRTFVTTGVNHVPFADPYCADGRDALTKAASVVLDSPVDAAATMVVIDGPRFSSRAESQSYAAAGFTLVNMTGQPEASLARELGLCYTAVALVTDMDAGIDGGSGVTQDEAIAVFRAGMGTMRALLAATVEVLPTHRTCDCTRALDGLTPDWLPSSAGR